VGSKSTPAVCKRRPVRAVEKGQNDGTEYKNRLALQSSNELYVELKTV
jgi:hypothetical protein